MNPNKRPAQAQQPNVNLEPKWLRCLDIASKCFHIDFGSVQKDAQQAGIEREGKGGINRRSRKEEREGWSGEGERGGGGKKEE